MGNLAHIGKNAKYVMHTDRVRPPSRVSLTLKISFSRRCAEGKIPHEDDPMMITLQICDWNVKRVLGVPTARPV